MKLFFFFITLLVASPLVTGQNLSDKTQIENTLNYYIDGFYKGDTVALKKALRPRLYKFGYWKNKDTGSYEYYAKMNYTDALEFVQKMKEEGRTRDENEIRQVEVLDIGNHIASAKVTAAWGIDYMTLSKDNGQWLIEQVIWEGPYEKSYSQQPTTYYLIRHAEKDKSDKSNRNPHLTIKGKQRAENWAKVFKDVKFDMVYSTDYYRTIETANPIAASKDIEVSIYNARDIDLESFKKITNGKTVLIVGHSNTTPNIANGLLGEKKYKMIDATNNANLYIVSITKDTNSSSLLKIE